MVLAEFVEEDVHVCLDLLRVAEHVSALLPIYTGHAVEETALQTQRNGGAGLQDLGTCFLDVDLLNSLAADSLGARLVTNRCHEPAAS